MIIAKFKKRKKKLIFFGSRHGNDIKQLKAIKREVIKLKPEIILVESEFHKAHYNSQKEAIKHGYESGYVSYLGKKLNIPIQSNDSPESYSKRKIAEKYGKELAFLYFMLRSLIYGKRKINLEYYFKNTAGYFWHETRWKDFDYNYRNFNRIFNKYLKEEFNLRDNYSDYFNPTLDISILNRISRDLDVIRDKYMLKLIKKLLKKYNKIFIIKGSGHLFFEKENLQKIFDKV